MAEEKQEVGTLERGNIYFFFRPRVEEEDPEDLDDVQSMYVVLSPHGVDEYRLAIIGRKRLPDPGGRQERRWGFVDLVDRDPKNLVDALGPEEYETKTRGARHQPAARPAGEGVYRILRHGDHTHFVHALELPERPGTVQQEMEIEEEASYVISIKNPKKASPRSAGLSDQRKARYPKRLQERFEGRRFIDAEPELLDYQGCEFVLISAAEDVTEELGVELEPQDEDESRAEIFNDLRLEKSKQPIAPLFEGEWE